MLTSDSIAKIALDQFYANTEHLITVLQSIDPEAFPLLAEGATERGVDLRPLIREAVRRNEEVMEMFTNLKVTVSGPGFRFPMKYAVR